MESPASHTVVAQHIIIEVVLDSRLFFKEPKREGKGDKEFKTKCFSAYTEMQAPLDGFFPLE